MKAREADTSKYKKIRAEKIKAEEKYSGSAAEYRRQKEQFFKNIAISERKNRKDVY